MNWVRNMSVGQRLAFGFGLSSLLLLLIGGSSWWVLSSVKRGVDEIVSENNKKTDMAWRMRAELEETARSVRNLIVTRDNAVQAKQKELQAEARKRFDGIYQSLEALLVDAEENNLYTTIGQLRGVVLPLLDEAMEQAQRGMKEMASETLIDKVQKPQTQWIEAMQALIDLQSQRTAASSQAMKSGYALATVALLGGMAAAVVISLALGLGLSRSLLRQLGGEPLYARNVARRIASGDLGEQIALRSGDQDSLLAAMHEMQ